MTVETVYKLTDKHAQTFNNTQWGPGVEHTAPGDGPLCTKAWIHACRDPMLAVLLNPVHGNFDSPRLWRCEAIVGAEDDAKVGCTWLKTVEELPLPEVTVSQRMRFAILCAQRVCDDPAWTKWADDWLSGVTRLFDLTLARARTLPAAAKLTVTAAFWHDSYDQVSFEHYVAFAAIKAMRADPSIDLVALAHEAVRNK